VGLLVEYHPLGEGALFLNGRPPPSLRPTQWLVLNTLREVSQTSLTKSGSSLSVMTFQYTLIASENITNSPKLLQLLESRFNMVLISREYEPLKKKNVQIECILTNTDFSNRLGFLSCRALVSLMPT
jgi:hypothetical protein